MDTSDDVASNAQQTNNSNKPGLTTISVITNSSKGTLKERKWFYFPYVFWTIDFLLRISVYPLVRDQQSGINCESDYTILKD